MVIKNLEMKKIMDQYLIDNPNFTKSSNEYIKFYRDTHYKLNKEKLKNYQKDYRLNIKSNFDSKVHLPEKEFLIELNKFIYILKLKEMVTLTELLKIVVYWSECNNQSVKIKRFKCYNKYPVNKQLELMWKDINWFNDKWKKLLL